MPPEISKICARVFASVGLIHILLILLLLAGLAFMPWLGAFWVYPMPSAKGSVWINLNPRSLELSEMLPAINVGGSVYCLLLFVLGKYSGNHIWKNAGAYATISMLTFLIAGIVAGTVSGVVFEFLNSGSDFHSPNLFLVFVIVFLLVLPSILFAVFAGWLTKKRMEDRLKKPSNLWFSKEENEKA